MKIVAIICGKLAIIAGKILKRGSVLPGRLALKIDKKIMYKIKLPKIVIAVTGSSGKGSTTKLIADTLRDNNYSVVHNISGANLTDGILTTILENCTLTGKIKKDVLVIETDERYAKYVFPALKPNYVVITNITRDQPPRQGNFDLVFNEIKKALTNDMKLVLNADDPYLQKFALDNYDITYYGINKNEFSSENPLFENLNLVYCPKCNSKLEYDFLHFENIGYYKCSNCNLKHPVNNYSVSNIDYEKQEITINDNIVKIPFPMLFAIYNTLAAYTVLNIYLDEKKVVRSINKITTGNINQFNCLKENNRLVYVLNNKNENSTTFNQSLLFLNRDQKAKTIVIGWKEISRRYKFNDLSWLYDINFELLKKHNIEKLVCVGVQRYDIATRLKLANLDQNKILCFEDLNEACKYLKDETKENIYAILNFDYVEPFTCFMKEENHD